jgi:hypothetical protein
MRIALVYATLSPERSIREREREREEDGWIRWKREKQIPPQTNSNGAKIPTTKQTEENEAFRSGCGGKPWKTTAVMQWDPWMPVPGTSHRAGSTHTPPPQCRENKTQATAYEPTPSQIDTKYLLNLQESIGMMNNKYLGLLNDDNRKLPDLWYPWSILVILNDLSEDLLDLSEVPTLTLLGGVVDNGLINSNNTNARSGCLLEGVCWRERRCGWRRCLVLGDHDVFKVSTVAPCKWNSVIVVDEDVEEDDTPEIFKSWTGTRSETKARWVCVTRWIIRNEQY